MAWNVGIAVEALVQLDDPDADLVGAESRDVRAGLPLQEDGTVVFLQSGCILTLYGHKPRLMIASRRAIDPCLDFPIRAIDTGTDSIHRPANLRQADEP